MRLYEYEAKQLLATTGIAVPEVYGRYTLEQLSKDNALAQHNYPYVLKGQVLFGNRLQAGFIHLVHDDTERTRAVQTLQQSAQNHELSLDQTEILVEALMPFNHEFYLAVRYDTRYRQPVLLFSQQGGSGIEQRGHSGELEMITHPLPQFAQSTLPSLPSHIPESWVRHLLEIFFEHDMTLLEINPLVATDTTGELMVLDCKLELDDTATFRHEEWQEYPPRTLFARQPTQREQEAKAVNAMDHRGIAGAAYFEFPGTVGILASGGGASLLAMDSLLASGLQPANYTEYSGNPPREKVAALTKVVLSQPNLEGLWVIGGHANFTDIYETLMGVMDGVESAQLPAGFPIVIRRGGPRQEEGFHAVQERAAHLGVAIQTFDSATPITTTLEPLVKAIETRRKQA